MMDVIKLSMHQYQQLLTKHGLNHINKLSKILMDTTHVTDGFTKLKIMTIHQVNIC